MDSNLCDQVIYILIDPGSNYSYVSHKLVNKCGLSKEMHAESWLVKLDRYEEKNSPLGKSMCI